MLLQFLSYCAARCLSFLLCRSVAFSRTTLLFFIGKLLAPWILRTMPIGLQVTMKYLPPRFWFNVVFWLVQTRLLSLLYGSFLSAPSPRLRRWSKTLYYIHLLLTLTATTSVNLTRLYCMLPYPSHLIIKRISRTFINTVRRLSASRSILLTTLKSYKILRAHVTLRMGRLLRALAKSALNKLVVVSVEITVNILFYASISATSTSTSTSTQTFGQKFVSKWY